MIDIIQLKSMTMSKVIFSLLSVFILNLNLLFDPSAVKAEDTSTSNEGVTETLSTTTGPGDGYEMNELITKVSYYL